MARSARTAADGVLHALRTERNLRIQLAGGVVVTGLGAWLGLGPAEWASVLLSIGLVITTELLNSALETAVDLVTTEVHPLAKAAKDVAAGAALAAALTAVGVATCVFGPRLAAMT